MHQLSFLEGTKLRKMVAAGFTALFLASGAGAAVAGHNGDGTEHLPQDKGLCTAYHNGSERGQEQKRKATAFEQLTARAEAALDDGNPATTDPTGPDAVLAFCDGLIGGRPGADDPNSPAPGGDNAGPKQ